jgi:hypothetical protein
VVSYALAGVGLVVAVVSAWMLVKRTLNHRAANPIFVKFATRGDGATMRKLCRAPGVNGAYVDAIDAAVVAGLAAGRDPAAVEAAVEGAYDRVSLDVAKAWKAWAERGLLGAIVAVAGLGLAVSEGAVPRPLLVMTGVAAAAGVFLATKRGAMVDALLETREAVLPSLVAAVSGGASVAATTSAAETPRASAPEPTPAAETQPPSEATLAPGAMRLRILRDGALVRCQTLEHEVTKIGRQPSAHVHLDDHALSRMHAVIECTDEGASVIDLGSSMGTIVNGEKVNKKRLRNGDVIELGPFRLEVEAAAAGDS